ncbi:MAG: hypothetical protein HY001_03930 [Candidatus Portnoybacteria bacterium]|nr:hypothetical protein [Candidatus Portnoybacteria bacterium]
MRKVEIISFQVVGDLADPRVSLAEALEEVPTEEIIAAMRKNGEDEETIMALLERIGRA